MTEKLKHTEQELLAIRRDVADMWQQTLSQVQKAQQALLQNDKDLAREISSREKRINSYELKIESDCENYIALFAPVAIDLRLVLSLLNISNTLERIADFADGIARQIIDDNTAHVVPALQGELRLEEMLATVIEMLSNAYVALQQEDTNFAGRILSKDSTVDAIYGDGLKRLADYAKHNPEHSYEAIQTAIVMRKIERIGDHCSNIVEDIVFYIDAKVLKHYHKKPNAPESTKE